MFTYFTKRPMLLTAAATCLIGVVGYYSPAVLAVVTVLLIIVFIVLLFVKQSSPAASVFLLLLAAISLMSVNTRIEELNRMDGRTAEGEFIICEKPNCHGDYFSATVRVKNSYGLPENTKLYAFFYTGELRCGDIVEGRLRLKSLKDSDFRDSDYADRIYLQGSFQTIQKTGKTYAPLAAAEAIRVYITDTLFSQLEFEDASVLCALVQGDRSYLTDGFYQGVKDAGVSHVLVVSGMHMAVVIALLIGFVERFLYNRFLKALILVLTAGFMIVLCGFTKSVLRAGVTYLLFALALLLKRESDSANTLGAAVTLLLIVNPYTWLSAAFRLSVLSTFGILAVALPITRELQAVPLFRHRAVRPLLSAVLISVCAALFTMPEAVHDFGGIPVYSVVSCLLISTAATAALELAIVALAVSPVSAAAAKPMFAVCGLLIKYMRFVIDRIGGLESAFLPLGRSAVCISAAADFVILLGLFACQRKRNMLKLKKIEEKVIREGGKQLKWQSYTKKR